MTEISVPFLIHVEQHHINEGTCSSSRCPIALAIREQFGAVDVTVSVCYINIESRVFKTTPVIDRFIELFDDGVRMYPCVLEVTEKLS